MLQSGVAVASGETFRTTMAVTRPSPTPMAPPRAVSENDTADIDPLAYMIVDDKLYLNYSPKIQKVWEKDIPGRIAKADANWPGLQRKP